MKKVYVETYGCQMNIADTELLLGILAPYGFSPAATPAEADVIMINTCAIREHAEDRVLGRLGDLGRYKARKPGTRLGLVGCMAQHHRRGILEKAPFLDFVVGPDAYRQLPRLVASDADDPLVEVRLDRGETYADVTPAHGEGVRAWVTAMRGCDRFCTFCVVPLVRGRERSVPAGVLLSQVRALAEEGYREVVYLGQTVNAYRDADVDFAELLLRTSRIEGVERVRFTSPHPADMSDRLIGLMATCEKVCPYVHLPLQSASNRILDRMARGYTVEQYGALVERMRRAIPDLALSTDVIVGFPGEDEEDFRATHRFMAEIGYDHAFMFRYSAREGTRAYAWPETVSEEEKGRRLREIVELQERTSARINRALVGGSVQVLVEGPARRQKGWVAGKTRQFKTAVFPGEGIAPGELVTVRVDSATAHTLIGEAAPRRGSASSERSAASPAREGRQ